MPGMHGNYTAVTSMQESDLLIALGSRFDDRVTGKVPAFAPDAKIIHVDIDPAELGKVRRADVGIQGDCRIAIERLIQAIRELGGAEAQPDRNEWKARISGWRENFPLTYEPSKPGDQLKPQYVLETLRDNTPDDTIVVSGVGQHQMWTSQYWKFKYPYTWVNSGGLGTMGFAVPAAIGAKVGRPDRMVWAVDGDGCFQMTAQELVTAAAERIPVKIAILNNAYLGMVRQWQEMFYEERYSEVYLSPDLPDYKMWAEAMGCVGMRVEDPEEVLAGDREGQLDRRSTGGHRLPHRLGRKGVPDGPGGRIQHRHRRRPEPAVRSSTASGAGDERRSDHDHGGRSALPHARGARREQAGRADPGRRACSPAAGFNIDSLAVARTDDPRFSRITIMVDAESAPLEQVVKQLDKLINVVEIRDLDPSESVERELMMVIVKGQPHERGQIMDLVRIFEARVLNVGGDKMMLSLSGRAEPVG